jgi:hypothetical protein
LEAHRAHAKPFDYAVSSGFDMNPVIATWRLSSCGRALVDLDVYLLRKGIEGVTKKWCCG